MTYQYLSNVECFVWWGWIGCFCMIGLGRQRWGIWENNRWSSRNTLIVFLAKVAPSYFIDCTPEEVGGDICNDIEKIWYDDKMTCWTKCPYQLLQNILEIVLHKNWRGGGFHYPNCSKIVKINIMQFLINFYTLNWPLYNDCLEIKIGQKKPYQILIFK